MAMYIVERTGELVECVNKDVALDSSNVVIVISPTQKRIYTWIGNQAAPQSKFACARETARIRMETGYKVVNLEEQDISKDFLTAVDEIVANSRAVQSAQLSSSSSTINVSSQNTQKKSVQETASSSITSNSTSTRSSTMMVTQTLLSQTDSSLLEKNIEEILEQLDKLPPISGKIRDYIIIRDKLYVAPFEQDNWNELEEVMLDDGSFIAEDYVSRILIQDGKISAIELWRDI